MKRSTKKRKPTSDNNLCIICQESMKDSLEQMRQASLRTLKDQLREGKNEILVIMKQSNKLKNALQMILSHQFMLKENVIQSLLTSGILIGYLPNCLRPFKVRHHRHQKLLILNSHPHPNQEEASNLQVGHCLYSVKDRLDISLST